MAGKIDAGEKKEMNITMTIMADRLLKTTTVFSNVVAGSMSLNTYTRISEINTFSFLKLPLSLNSLVSFFDTDFPLNDDLCILLTDPPNSDRCNSFMRTIRFGYDSKSTDFEVVRVVGFVKLEPEIYYRSRVEIYDLSKDRWREIESLFLGNRFWTPSFKMCHEGTCYWWGLSEEGTGTLDTFDMSGEVFGQIPI
ncbi:F-box protein CPR30-like [Cucumis melo var. makuwa]|uniref:F-box protein CPR30-like n=1 Tax=Cucumis melo var. makuwa TaxID=1194695 RepID=A0A5D3BPQ5_CUCMM|nr:F-box protein CPR30-like [Cucumis melo var. makuwa]